MSNDTWIKMSERKPTESDLEKGIVVGCYRDGAWSESSIFHRGAWDDDRTHWTPAPKLPPPPKPEPTQREEDHCAWVAYTEGPGKGLSWGQTGDLWHAALAYRDAQNRADLENIGQYSAAFDTSAHVVARFNLRRRCGLDK